MTAAGMLAATGCGGSASATGSSSALEKPDITIGVVPAIANAGLYIAYMRGFFTAQGLHVKLVPVPTSAGASLTSMLRGGVDMLAGNYVSEIQAEANNPSAVKLHVVAEGSLTAPNSRAIMVPAGSKIKNLAQLEGKTVAVNALGNAASMEVESALSTHGLSPASVHLVAIPFPNEGAALNAHQVDAAWMTEPFITAGEVKYGLTELYDTNNGTTAAFPIDGSVSTAAWAQKYPKTEAAFVRALDQGQQLADSSKPILEAAMMKFLGVAQKIASVMAVDTYPVGVSRVRMQRVADQMYQFGLLTHPFNMAAMTG
jgi:NitT/TauT family transport system substrate-binding protein